MKGEALKGVPTCPFLSKKTEKNDGSDTDKIEKKEITGSISEKVLTGNDVMYNGLGHTEGSLSFFPFSAGTRSCPAKSLGLQVIRKVSTSSKKYQ